jgi:hypothetical protein
MKYMPRHTAFGKLKAMSDAAAMVRKEISQAANVLAHHAPTNCQGFQFSNSYANACNTVIASEAKQSMNAWIASSRSLSSGAHSRDPLAPRNDGRTRVRALATQNARDVESSLAQRGRGDKLPVEQITS